MWCGSLLLCSVCVRWWLWRGSAQTEWWGSARHWRANSTLGCPAPMCGTGPFPSSQSRRPWFSTTATTDPPEKPCGCSPHPPRTWCHCAASRKLTWWDPWDHVHKALTPNTRMTALRWEGVESKLKRLQIKEISECFLFLEVQMEDLHHRHWAHWSTNGPSHVHFMP